MKKAFVFFFLAFYHFSFAQPNEPVTIKGKIANCKDSMLTIFYRGEIREFTDSIKINVDGSFFYKTDKIDGPIYANITNFKSVQIPIYLAPGYNLSITANAINYKTIRNTTRYVGIGSKSNQYFNIENEAFSRKDTINWFEKSEPEFIANYLVYPNVDSLVSFLNDSIFGQNNTDPYKDYFRQASVTTVRFEKMFYILSYAYNKDMSPEETKSFLYKNFDTVLLNNMNNDAWLSSGIFKELIGGSYLNFLKSLDYEKDLGLKAEGNYYGAGKISATFSGNIRDYLLNDYLSDFMIRSTNLKDLETLHSYIQKIKSREIQDSLLALYEKIKNNLKMVQAGESAPAFNLPDTAGNFHSLKDFAGKVVYIDLWATWCGPCLEEIPFLKTLVQKFKNNKQIVFIGIAVDDDKNQKARYKIIRKNQIDWLQLEDQNNMVANAYLYTTIPRFIIIDKYGKIVTLDGPQPSAGKGLEDLLVTEMER